MKLKKAMREYARAVDKLALVTERIRCAELMCNKRDPRLLELHAWRDEARREKKRAVRQMHAVMSAMQYRGANKIAYEQPILLATKRDELYVYIARLAWETNEIRDKMLSLCSVSIKDEVEKGTKWDNWYSRTLGWRSDVEFYANGVLASAISERYPLDSYAELNVHMFSQKWEDKRFVSIIANGTIEECIDIDVHANCDG